MAVTEFEIKSRSPLAKGVAFGEVGPYEHLEGIVHLGTDPNHPRNRSITDLDLAPRDADGRVRSSAEFSILRPANPQMGNHRIFLDVLNRGRRRALKYFNSALDPLDPSAPLDPGNGFLMREGYTVVWCGWQHDVPPDSGLLSLKVPDALGPDGRPISGRISVTFQPNGPTQVQALSDRMHRPYPAVSMDNREATLMVRDYDDAPPVTISHDRWSFAKLEGGQVVPDPSHVYMASGFVPGKMYEVVYTAVGAPVVGLGLLATRDTVSFLKHGSAQTGNPCADDIQYAYAFGASQSGRFLRQLLYMELNDDEEDRRVFDGLIPHIAGGRRGEFNQRFGQPSRFSKWSMGAMFPFTDTEQTEPETERIDGLLSRLMAKDNMPRVFFTNSSAEYWRGDASLIHTDVEGARDVDPSELVRIYHYAGTQHASGNFPLVDTNPRDGSRGQHRFNSVDYAPLLRAALVRLDRWVTSGEAPPPSRFPRLDEGTAAPPSRTAATFKSFAGVSFPAHMSYMSRLDFGAGPEAGIAAALPPLVGKDYPALVSAVDEDGNELGGIRLPDVSVPLATHTGWNLRHPDMGGSDQLLDAGGLVGSTLPFPATRTDRETTGDPRLSIEERYISRDDYLDRVRRAAQALVDEGYLLAEDIERVAEQSSERYDLFRSRVGEHQPTGN
ncbi:MAG: hypothetical protein J4F46_00210 [Dehalococcoidia bacterium]|nr:hypothetical protein [Dehalococcoidia bacterium]